MDSIVRDAAVAAVLTVGAFGLALARSTPETGRVLLAVAAGLSVLHSAATGRAAPLMFRIGRAEDAEAVLEPLLARFARSAVILKLPPASSKRRPAGRQMTSARARCAAVAHYAWSWNQHVN